MGKGSGIEEPLIALDADDCPVIQSEYNVIADGLALHDPEHSGHLLQEDGPSGGATTELKRWDVSINQNKWAVVSAAVLGCLLAVLEPQACDCSTQNVQGFATHNVCACTRQWLAGSCSLPCRCLCQRFCPSRATS